MTPAASLTESAAAAAGAGEDRDAHPGPPANAARAALAALCLLALLAAATLFAYRRHHRPIEELGAAELQDGPPLPRASYGRRLEPPGNTVLTGAGQTDWQSFLNYRTAVAPGTPPAIFMTYTGLRADLPAFFRDLRTTLADEPGVMPEIGLALNNGEHTAHFEAETAAGADDAALLELCNGLNSLQRPVFLRPGYEFNGSWNGYGPTGYVAAFRRIATRIHGCSAQTALVWNWSADAELLAERSGNTFPAISRWQPFYPGDDAVDWWGLNLFTAAGLRAAATGQFLQAAAASKHPVLIAESTPRGFDVASSATVWQDWYAPYFALIHTHPGIRASCYINWNWTSYPQWADWGNARVESAPPELQQRFRQELQQPLYAVAQRPVTQRPVAQRPVTQRPAAQHPASPPATPAAHRRAE